MNESWNIDTHLSRNVFRWGSVANELVIAMNNGVDPLHSRIFSLVNFGMAETSRSVIEMSDKFVFEKSTPHLSVMPMYLSDRLTRHKFSASVFDSQNLTSWWSSKYRMISCYATSPTRHATSAIRHCFHNNFCTCPRSVCGHERCWSGGIVWRSKHETQFCQVGVGGIWREILGCNEGDMI